MGFECRVSGFEFQVWSFKFRDSKLNRKNLKPETWNLRLETRNAEPGTFSLLLYVGFCYNPAMHARRHVPRIYAWRRRLKRRFWQFVVLVVAVVAAALVLQFFFKLSDYAPKFYEPKDLERGKQLQKEK